jgi:hypothetical protein
MMFWSRWRVAVMSRLVLQAEIASSTFGPPPCTPATPAFAALVAAVVIMTTGWMPTDPFSVLVV